MQLHPFNSYSHHMIPKLRPDLCTKLFQRVIVSCQYLYHLEWIELVSWQSVYNRFTEFWFYTLIATYTFHDKKIYEIWYLVDYLNILRYKIEQLYKLTDLWRIVKAHHCHIVTSLQIKDCIKNVDMPKRLKKWNSDRIRSLQSEKVKSSQKTKFWIKNITDILYPMKEKPKHSLREHILSLLWL